MLTEYPTLYEHLRAKFFETEYARIAEVTMQHPEEAERLKAYVLEWVNELRTDRKLKPIAALPPGSRSDNTACPIAKALITRAIKTPDDGYRWARVEPDLITATGWTRGVYPPFLVGVFIVAFRHGAFPELGD